MGQHVVSDKSRRQHHANQIGRQHRLAPGPGGEAAEPEQDEQEIFRFQLGWPVTVALEQAPRQPRDRDEDRDGYRREGEPIVMSFYCASSVGTI